MPPVAVRMVALRRTEDADPIGAASARRCAASPRSATSPRSSPGATNQRAAAREGTASRADRRPGRREPSEKSVGQATAMMSRSRESSMWPMLSGSARVPTCRLKTVLPDSLQRRRVMKRQAGFGHDDAHVRRPP